MSEATITSLVPWFGAKRVLAPLIASQFGPHRCYWEPFCGSMAVLMAKERVASETVNDLHGDLINLARTIQHPKWGPWLYRALRRKLVHEEFYWEAAERMANPMPAEMEEDVMAWRAVDFFVSTWLGRNGLAGTTKIGKSFCVRYTANGGIHGTRYHSAVTSIPQWRKRLEAVSILRRDGFDLLKRIDDAEGTVIYCDPPYVVKGASYIHDFTPQQHAELARILRTFKKARVLVSHYENDALKDWYRGWTKIECHVTSSLSNQGKRGGACRINEEVLLINGPDLVEEGALF